ncbi:MAG TPA: GFA family protein [Alphaproteobacteria bacterium]|nr:GFA family protein [Alphaproteobacteria bacterium]
MRCRPVPGVHGAGRVHYCHCRMCQKAVGNIFAMLVPVRRDRLEWSGELSLFRSSSVAERGFCRHCGTPLSFAYLASDWMAVTLGSVDRPDLLPPEIHYGIESRMPWLHIADGLPCETTGEDDPDGRLVGLVSRQHPDRP